MAIGDKIKSFLSARTPEAQLSEIERKIAAAQAEWDQHASRRPAEIVAKLTGDPDAAARVAAIDGTMAALDAHLRDLRQGAGELRRRIAEAQANERLAEAEARPRRIAELRRERQASAREVTKRMAEAAAAMKAIAANGDELAMLLDGEPARRFFSFEAYRSRVQSAFARVFAIDPTQPLTRRNSLLGIESGEIGERAHWTAAEHEQRGLDDLAPFFDNEAEATAARERLAARQTPTVVVALPGGCFTLVPVERVFGDRQGAATAARGAQLAIVAHGGGFVLVPERFSGRAA